LGDLCRLGKHGPGAGWPARPAQEPAVGEKRLAVFNRQVSLAVQGQGGTVMPFGAGVVSAEFGQLGVACGGRDPGKPAWQPCGSVIEPGKNAFSVINAARRQVGVHGVPRPRDRARLANAHLVHGRLQLGVPVTSISNCVVAQVTVAEHVIQE